VETMQREMRPSFTLLPKRGERTLIQREEKKVKSSLSFEEKREGVCVCWGGGFSADWRKVGGLRDFTVKIVAATSERLSSCTREKEHRWLFDGMLESLI